MYTIQNKISDYTFILQHHVYLNHILLTYLIIISQKATGSMLVKLSISALGEEGGSGGAPAQNDHPSYY